jgi:MYXO-CTERM domain-containing protein
MKSMTLGVFAYVLAFASTPGHALIFDSSVTAEDGGGPLGLILASVGLLLLAWWRRRHNKATG